ncbi:ABC transporter permease [Flavitalea sp. BT771]|uniref:ABC transporter permease n=1 Tax=Flavitalea sp. BT771 TaxID=3063329 RepID=UPI0026E3C99F|nr:ABC transporter permease [Flavitalea sp. BT771]MDO6431750.1 ABC transporter permease [Flavitalea sp. BT771]MDV6220658.1 ABC transporter permease [Flavitalea sp. BT771]
MIKSYLTIAWRNLTNNKVYSALNILGLAIGMAVALLIGLWVYYQSTYDRFLPGYQQVCQVRYRVESNGQASTYNSVSYPLAEVLKKDIPGIQYVAQTDWITDHGLVAGEKKLILNGIMAGEDFLKIFQYPLLKGNPGDVLKDMYSIVLTQSTARSLFGDENPLNRTVRIDNSHDLKVTGIMEDIPENSSIRFHYIIPYSYFVATENWGRKWWNNNLQTFVSLQPNVAYEEVEPQLRTILKKYSIEEYKTTKAEVFFHPLTKLHLFTEFKNGVASGGFVEYVHLFGIIGLLVLLIACINFMNLYTARSERRAREVGIRKAMGSIRKSLILQFLLESAFITSIAFIISLLIVQITLPAFSTLTGTNLRVPYSNGYFWLIMIGYVLLTALLAGSRPAFYLSSFKPIKVLKGSVHMGPGASLPRKILVTVQFTASIALIIITIIVYQQIQYGKDRSIGYDARRLVMTGASPDITRNYDALKNELLQSGVVSSVTKSSSPVTAIWVVNGVDDWEGRQPNDNLGLGTIAVSDADYFRTMGMEIKEGRDFTGNRGTDSFAVILNEAAAKRLGYTAALGKSMLMKWYNPKPVKVVAVVKDALMESPFSPVKPTLFVYDPGWSNIVTYRLSPSITTSQAIGRLTSIFNKYNPSYPFTYDFVDQSYAAKFGFETLINKLAGLFSILAIFICCLGLFGLAAYTAEQRTKEIGIRKVLGASIGQVWILLSKDFLLLVAISCMMAAPIAFYYLHHWLQQYEYRITIQPLVFVVAGASAITLTLLTVSFQAIKAALANPVKSLRTE